MVNCATGVDVRGVFGWGKTAVKSQTLVWQGWLALWGWWQRSDSSYRSSCLETGSWGLGLCSLQESGRLCLAQMCPQAWRQGWTWPRPAPPGWTYPSSWFYDRRQRACWSRLISGWSDGRWKRVGEEAWLLWWEQNTSPKPKGGNFGSVPEPADTQIEFSEYV